MLPKITAVVILYYPSSDIIHNIQSYIKPLHTLYIVCNSPISPTLYKQLLAIDKINIIHHSQNIGIAKALNLALQKASQDNQQWLLTLDQDSSFKDNDFTLFLSSFQNHKNQKNLAIFTPIHNKKFIKNRTKNTSFVMTSGNIVNVAIALKIGGYDEKLFIDEVDHEFCFRLQKHHYIILQNHSIALKHHLGEIHTKGSKKVVLYPSIRLYFMTRNYLYLKHNYQNAQPLFFKQRDKYLFIFFLKQIYYGKKKLQNIKMIAKGLYHYKKNIYRNDNL